MTNKGLKILAHAAVWAIVLSLPYLLDSQHGVSHHPDNNPYERAFFYLNALTNLLWIGPFYINKDLLTPRLFNNRRYLPYAGFLAVIFGAVLLMHAFLFRVIFGIPRFSVMGAVWHLLPAYVLTIAIGTTLWVVQDKMKTDKLAQERQEENLKTELSFLRSQINPHFIFNILNNLVALERLKSPELGPTILKLSSLMQYMLYDTDEESVSLSSEVEYLQSYIDLQRQRFGEKVPITVSMEVPVGAYEIEPMLLIPFVENAFKHGVGRIEAPAIEIHLRVKDGALHFSVGNRYNPVEGEVKDKSSGIGLANVKRRLNLLYGRQHALRIQKDKDWFAVSLELNLHS
jgi:LytS/YehU family sensor histidine kinase